MDSKKLNDKQKNSSILNSTSSIVGSSIGGITGSMIGVSIAGFPGVVLGSVVDSTIGKGVEDFLNRILSTREKSRIDIVTKYAITEIERFLEEGKTPRNDDFFRTDTQQTSNADEIFEGVLLKAKNEYQEKKLKFLGYFFARISFRDDVSISSANHLLKIAENLSYRQFCFLTLIDKIDNLDIKPLRGRIHDNLELSLLRQEEMNLHDSNDFGGYGLVTGDYSGYGFADYLSEEGKLFVDLFNLSTITKDELSELINLLLKTENSTKTPPLFPDKSKTYSYNKIADIMSLLN